MIRLLAWFLAWMMLCGPCLPLVAEAANHYIRDGGSGSTTGTGNCADWTTTNACDQLPATLVRGDTYYVASGSYTSRNYSQACSGGCDITDLITIQGATVSDHGTSTGWLSTMSVDTRDGGSQAVWSSAFTATTSYIKFTGSVWGDSDVNAPWCVTSTCYGFRLGPTTLGGDAIGIFNLSNTISNVTIEGVYSLSNGGTESGGSQCTGPSAFIATDNSTYAVTDVTIRHNMMSNHNNTVWATAGAGPSGQIHDRWVYEYNVADQVHGSEPTGQCHAEDFNNNYGFMDHVTIRYNWFRGPNSHMTGTIVAGLNGSVGTYDIYGNLFTNKTGGDGMITCVHENGTVNVYNNTIVSSDPGSGNGPWVNQDSGDCVMSGAAKNNLLYSMEAAHSVSFSPTHNAYFSTTSTPSDTNGYTASGNPFVASGSSDYRLNTALSIVTSMPAGATLSSPYNVDMFGCVRGQDGKWDRGFLESDVSGCSVAPPGDSPGQLNLHLRLKATYELPQELRDLFTVAAADYLLVTADASH